MLEYATPILQGYIDENPCRKILVTAHSLGGAVGEILVSARFLSTHGLALSDEKLIFGNLKGNGLGAEKRDGC